MVAILWETLISDIDEKENLINGSVKVRIDKNFKGYFEDGDFIDSDRDAPVEKKVFIKYGTGGAQANEATMAVEAKGLYHLRLAAPTDLIFVPRVWRAGQTRMGTGYIILDHLDFTSKSSDTAAKLGKGLAMIHKNSSCNYQYFGFEADGHCGAFPQLNNSTMRTLTWLDFWREYRLRPQLDGIKQTCPSQQRLIELGEQLCSRLGELFSMLVVEDIERSCLHGDLWSGNWGSVSSGNGPVAALFDPACYYGHSEADLGIAHMFGMPPAFFSTYFAELPKAAGFDKRKDLYELYHHLNHLNIFGSGYAQGALKLLQQILK